MGHTKIETTLKYYTDVDDALRFENQMLVQTMGIMPTPEEMVFDETSEQGDMVYNAEENQSGKILGNSNTLRLENGLLIEEKA